MQLRTGVRAAIKIAPALSPRRELGQTMSPTISYGSNSIKSKSLDIWNFTNKLFSKENIHVKSRFSCKKLVIKLLDFKVLILPSKLENNSCFKLTNFFSLVFMFVIVCVVGYACL